MVKHRYTVHEVALGCHPVPRTSVRLSSILGLRYHLDVCKAPPNALESSLRASTAVSESRPASISGASGSTSAPASAATQARTCNNTSASDCIGGSAAGVHASDWSTPSGGATGWSTFGSGMIWSKNAAAPPRHRGIARAYTAQSVRDTHTGLVAGLANERPRRSVSSTATPSVGERNPKPCRAKRLANT